MKEYEKATRRIARRLAQRQKDLTEDQIVEALLQSWPDFVRNINVSTNSQSVTYLPASHARYWQERCTRAEGKKDEVFLEFVQKVHDLSEVVGGQEDIRQLCLKTLQEHRHEKTAD